MPPSPTYNVTAINIFGEKKMDDLTSLPGVGPATADKLLESGFTSYLSLAVASASEIADVANIGESAATKAIIASRQVCNVGFMTGKDLMDQRKIVLTFKTPVESINELLGGGIQTQAITEVHGQFGCGKSQMGFTLAVLVAGMDAKARKALDKSNEKPFEVAFIDTEGTFRPNRIKQIAESLGLKPDEVLSRIHCARGYNSDHQMLLAEKVSEMINSGANIKLVVVDSLTSMFRNEYTGRGQLAGRQQKLNRHMHTLQKLSDLHNLAVFVTNQVMAKPDVMFGPAVEAIGGNIVGHNSTYRVYLRRGKGGTRVAKLVDSPDLPEGEAVFCLSEQGISDK